ncbi:PaaI family thioesterase [Berryella wangjianweii]|uniref:PaaI family thioesterase n=1 Tax=Berryella wangjianweii TaxID=2734634 RepID=A0A6M8IYV6_9ACTN|nr:PaaI family thioesterase [Berryella wangjianweii]NPD32330.1 PaaI family thioesterase [Eggerthellaceae bacterium zg-997]QKF06900.1 PaaI family thioesterase [Berryella wangjianweii]
MTTKKPNPAWCKAVLAAINESGYLSYLGLTVDEMGDGFARGSVVIEERHLNAFGNVHGGMLASMIDNITFWAAFATLPEGSGATTLDVQCSYLRACGAGQRVTYEARPIKRGRTIVLVECELRTDAGELVAHGVSKLFVSPAIQPPEALFERAAQLCGSLPARYLDA